MDDIGHKVGAKDTATFWYDYNGNNFSQEKIVNSPFDELSFDWEPLDGK